MKDLRNDAARLSFLHDVGIVSSDEIVQWADALIVSEEKPSQALIELSTSSAKVVGDVLRQMAVGADVWSPVDAALPKIPGACAREAGERSDYCASVLSHRGHSAV